MYAWQQVRIVWNCSSSSNWSITNRVKQGGIVSPILFLAHTDVLLTRLYGVGIDRHIGPWIVSSLAYADDINLKAPTAGAMR